MSATMSLSLFVVSSVTAPVELLILMLADPVPSTNYTQNWSVFDICVNFAPMGI